MSINTILFNDTDSLSGFWSIRGPFSDIVISSRVRFSRNMRDVLFPERIGSGEAEIIFSRAKAFIEKNSSNSELVFIELNKSSNFEKRLLRERNIITNDMESGKFAAVIHSLNDDFTIMVNDTDHFKIQVIKPGLDILEAFDYADYIDDELNKVVPYAFLPDRGYLSSSPVRLGTGMKASVILHLPSLVMKKQILTASSFIKESGGILQGTAGDGYRAPGSLFRVDINDNNSCSEREVLERLNSIAMKLIDFEDKSRDEYLSENRLELEDRIWRSYGLLSHARRVGYVEALQHLSNLRLGVILALLRDIELKKINELMVNIQWAHLQKIYGDVFNGVEECDEFRAEYLRKNTGETFFKESFNKE